MVLNSACLCNLAEWRKSLRTGLLNLESIDPLGQRILCWGCSILYTVSCLAATYWMPVISPLSWQSKMSPDIAKCTIEDILAHSWQSLPWGKGHGHQEEALCVRVCRTRSSVGSWSRQAPFWLFPRKQALECQFVSECTKMWCYHYNNAWITMGPDPLP